MKHKILLAALSLSALDSLHRIDAGEPQVGGKPPPLQLESVREQLGLELTPAKRPVEVLVVDEAKKEGSGGLAP